MREKLIELLTQVAVLGDYLDMRKVADHLIANGVTVQDSKVVEIDQFNKWIPVTERLPEERKSAVPALGSYSMPVLVVWERKCTGDRFVREGYTREGNFVNKTYNDDIVPVAWMPLPEPPKET